MKKYLIVLFLLTGCDMAKVSCGYSGLRGGSCKFTSSGLAMSKCVDVVIKKTAKATIGRELRDLCANPYMRNSAACNPTDYHDIGETIHSGPVCSGFFWSRETRNIEFDLNPNPVEVCGGWDNCTLDIEDAR